jgi:hypothetical protein
MFFAPRGKEDTEVEARREGRRMADDGQRKILMAIILSSAISAFSAVNQIRVNPRNPRSIQNCRVGTAHHFNMDNSNLCLSVFNLRNLWSN